MKWAAGWQKRPLRQKNNELGSPRLVCTAMRRVKIFAISPIPSENTILCTKQRRPWPDCADVQAGLDLSCSHMFWNPFSQPPAQMNCAMQMVAPCSAFDSAQSCHFFFFFVASIFSSSQIGPRHLATAWSLVVDTQAHIGIHCLMYIKSCFALMHKWLRSN